MLFPCFNWYNLFHKSLREPVSYLHLVCNLWRDSYCNHVNIRVCRCVSWACKMDAGRLVPLMYELGHYPFQVTGLMEAICPHVYAHDAQRSLLHTSHADLKIPACLGALSITLGLWWIQCTTDVGFPLDVIVCNMPMLLLWIGDLHELLRIPWKYEESRE